MKCSNCLENDVVGYITEENVIYMLCDGCIDFYYPEERE